MRKQLLTALIFSLIAALLASVTAFAQPPEGTGPARAGERAQAAAPPASPLAAPAPKPPQQTAIGLQALAQGQQARPPGAGANGKPVPASPPATAATQSEASASATAKTAKNANEERDPNRNERWGAIGTALGSLIAALWLALKGKKEERHGNSLMLYLVGAILCVGVFLVAGLLALFFIRFSGGGTASGKAGGSLQVPGPLSGGSGPSGNSLEALTREVSRGNSRVEAELARLQEKLDKTTSAASPTKTGPGNRSADSVNGTLWVLVVLASFTVIFTLSAFWATARGGGVGIETHWGGFGGGLGGWRLSPGLVYLLAALAFGAMLTAVATEIVSQGRSPEPAKTATATGKAGPERADK